MTEVVDFEAARRKREEEQGEPADPHWHGKCVCLGCRNEWEAVGPMGVNTGLTCPECNLPKGVTKFMFGSAPGDMVLTCLNCDGEALTAYLRKGRHHVLCMSCGMDLTQAFFDAGECLR